MSLMVRRYTPDLTPMKSQHFAKEEKKCCNALLISAKMAFTKEKTLELGN